MAVTHPRDRFITVYGRQAVLEALADPALRIDKVLLADNARGQHAAGIVDAARLRGVRVERRTPELITRISRNGRHDQGVVADVEAPSMGPLEEADLTGPLLLLDGITNPSNVGMIVRTATAAGVGVVLPRSGVPDINPLVIKASAGVAFRARLLRAETAAGAAAHLVAAGYHLVGLAAAASTSLFDDEGLSQQVALVLGGESEGITPAVADHVARWVSIPLRAGVDSLNVAVAAGVVCFELVRRAGPIPGAGS